MQQQTRPSPSRRGFVTGTIAVGAAAAAASTAPSLMTKSEPQEAAEPAPKPERGGGYRVSEHVRRYYRTTLV